MPRWRNKKSGTARMIELGYLPLQLWLSPTIQEQLRTAAAEENEPCNRFALRTLTQALANRRKGKKGE